MTGSIEQALAQRAPQQVSTALGRVHFRSAGHAPGVSHVLLHGIGSGSASWVRQLQAADAAPGARVLAWDAPGYESSDPVNAEWPLAADYAARLWAWLDAMDVTGPVTLAGHSLGALMAAGAALLQPARVARLVLLAPARGYGNATPEEQQHKLQDRLATLNRLGPAGMAQARAAAMLSPQAAPELVAAVRNTMARVLPDGYTQAARLLVRGDLLADLARVHCPVQVASGSADTITPPAACDAVAAQCGVQRLDLGPVGHACTLEAAPAVNALLGLSTMKTPP